MSHALLLRLALSPHWSLHTALQYLSNYSDHVGISHYITRRMSEIDNEQLREVWGFICHLLVTRPSKSAALEVFVVEQAEASTHILLMTLWFMQAHLRDLSVSSRNSESFAICERVILQCHEMIYGEVPIASLHPYSTTKTKPEGGFRLLRRKIKPVVAPTLVGIGAFLAGAPGMPLLTPIIGKVAVEQSRRYDTHQKLRSLQPKDDDTATRQLSQDAKQSQEEANETEGDTTDGTDEMDPEGVLSESPLQPKPLPLPPTESSSQQTTPRKLFRRKTIGASQTSPHLPLRKGLPKGSLSIDPFSQLDFESKSRDKPKSPYLSSPSLQIPHSTRKSESAESVSDKYDIPTQGLLLRKHFCRTEVQFFLTLESISNRLLVVPKLARVSALRAELTALNHQLPAEICVPMWCTSSDARQPSKDVGQPHHRVVRIPPGECVVLNSAERAPFLLLIEILEGEMDFDPNKRSNKEVLRRMTSSGASESHVPFRSPHSRSIASTTMTPSGSLQRMGSSYGFPPEPPAEQPQAPLLFSPESNDEEMDLVEQVFGAEHSTLLTSADLNETIVLPTPPRNKALDVAAWSRTTSNPSTPRLDMGRTLPSSPPLTPASTNGLGISFPVHLTDPSSSQIAGHSQFRTEELSLQDYADRMSTAAAMLAQLNASLVRDTVTTIHVPGAPPPPTSSGHWIPGTSWITGSSASIQSPYHGDFNGGSSRMKLQRAEADAIRERIMKEMNALEEQRMERMSENERNASVSVRSANRGMENTEDEGIIRRELNKVDPSAAIFSESWAAKKSRIRSASPYGHLANWDCTSVIVKAGADLRQEQLAINLIHEFGKIWKEEHCRCFVRPFRILITGANSGLIETIPDAISIHSIKKAEYARRLAAGRFEYVTLYDHFVSAYGPAHTAKFAHAQRNFAQSLAGYSLATYFLQIKDRHNGNILLDRDGHLVHIDFGFILSNSPGNLGFEAAPFKFPSEYLEVLGGLDSVHYREFKEQFHAGFEAARKHCGRIITLVELMQSESALPCFANSGAQTSHNLRERFQLNNSLLSDHIDKLIVTSLANTWTRLYDSYQYYSQSIL
ncbi:kinase-like protein [Sistotremastrum niveocremeum HHB9708]|uniref:1-phosphatidylinositol 4-kinase n=2 Tax=Sistotremastraceae TaxID=3402574 RepID=A0A165AM07_9AGAM|nr:kinase-like protein [Sistotremastrum niveocremeum HHB9708]KZT42075.1 kinase-like protein [Sistotremastrum suecicum HHB10207 ss-3]